MLFGTINSCRGDGIIFLFSPGGIPPSHTGLTNQIDPTRDPSEPTIFSVQRRSFVLWLPLCCAEGCSRGHRLGFVLRRKPFFVQILTQISPSLYQSHQLVAPSPGAGKVRGGRGSWSRESQVATPPGGGVLPRVDQNHREPRRWEVSA